MPLPVTRTTCETGPVAEAPARERASSAVEYIGLGALATMLVTGLASAFDSGLGDRLGAVLVRRLLHAIGAG